MQAHDTAVAFAIVFVPIGLAVAAIAVYKVIAWRRSFA